MNTENNPFATEILEYPDDRIIDIIRHPKKFSASLVYGCRLEAEARNLNLVKEDSEDNPFASQATSYSDERLIRMLDGNVNYSPKLLEACVIEADRRGLDISVKPKETDIREHLMSIQKHLNNGTNVDVITEKLVSLGYSEEDALSLIDKAASMKKLKPISDKKGGTSGLGVFGTLFLIYIIIKWTYLLLR